MQEPMQLQVTQPGIQSKQPGTAEIDLVELLWHFGANIYIIVIATLVCAMLTGIYTAYFIKPRYESTAKLYVLNSKDSVVNLADLQIGSYLASDYQEVFKTWEVNDTVRENLNLDYTRLALQGMLRVTNPPSTRILYITVSSTIAAEAARIANEYASVVRHYIATMMQTEEPSIFSSAQVATVPVSPSLTRNVLLGAMLGGLLTLLVLSILFLLDDRIRTADDIQRYTGLVTLAVVPLSQTSTPQQEIAKPRNPSIPGRNA